LPESTGITTDRELRIRERSSLVAALRSASGRVSGAGGAAELVGVKPSTFASRVKAFDILESEWRA